jgi:hypothetical protein
VERVGLRKPLIAAWRHWKRFARRLGELQTGLVLTVLYFLLMPLVAPIVRRKDPLGLRRSAGWVASRGRAADLAAAGKQ